MRRFLVLLAVIACAVPLAACACGPTGVGQSACSAPQSACSAPLDAPCSQAAPLSVVGDYALEYGQPGAREQAQALFQIPAGAISCTTTALSEGLQVVGRYAHCLANAFFPPVAPSQRLVRLQGQGVAQSAACGPQFVDVQETYQEPVTQFVTKTRTVRKQVVPVQQADPCAPPQAPQTAPKTAPCQPAPQAAPKAPGCEPPLACMPGDDCSVPVQQAAK